MIDFLDSIYAKLPKLGTELREFIVKVLPVLSLIAGVLLTFSSIIDIIGTPFINLLSMGGGATIFQKLMIVNVLGFLEGIFLIIAFPALRKKSKKGWGLVLYSQLLWILSALLSFSPSFILGLLFLYPIFQIRQHYK